MEFRIRQETAADRKAVYAAVRAAFQNAQHTDHDEHNLVERLRQSDAFLPQLSLVAESDNQIVGHILFTQAMVSARPVLALAPLSVVPERQHEGIGSALVRAGHRAALSIGHTFSVVLGHPAYYPRFGYMPASLYGVQPPFPVPDDAFMACNLLGRPDRAEGVIQYAPAFFPPASEPS